MSNILFVLFQGSGTNLKSWNEYTESKFLDKLKKLGDIYTYQDKTHNIWYYDKSNPEHKDYYSDIYINLAYVRPNTHIKIVYNDLLNKYKNLKDYKIIPVGFSAGCYLALYFAQVYSSLCKCVILLDPALWTKDNMKLRLKSLKNDKAGYLYPITNSQYNQILNKLKNKNIDIEDIYKINNIHNIIRSEFIAKKLKLSLPIKTLAFVNIPCCANLKPPA
jgi:hypothetical protein